MTILFVHQFVCYTLFSEIDFCFFPIFCLKLGAINAYKCQEADFYVIFLFIIRQDNNVQNGIDGMLVYPLLIIFSISAYGTIMQLVRELFTYQIVRYVAEVISESQDCLYSYQGWFFSSEGVLCVNTMIMSGYIPYHTTTFHSDLSLSMLKHFIIIVYINFLIYHYILFLFFR